MLTILLLIIVCITVFIVSFLSPRTGTSLQKAAINLRNKLSDFLSTKSKAVRVLTGRPLLISHKLLHKTAHKGKAARTKIQKTNK